MDLLCAEMVGLGILVRFVQAGFTGRRVDFARTRDTIRSGAATGMTVLSPAAICAAVI